MIKGIWLNKYDLSSIQQAQRNGIRGLFINPDSFFPAGNRSAEEYLASMKYVCGTAKECGFTHFLIGVTWGFYPLDGGDFWVKVYNAFKDDPNVRFESEELFTLPEREDAFIDGRRFNEIDVIQLIAEKYKKIGSKLFVGEVFRHLPQPILRNPAPTSYEFWGYLKSIKKYFPPYVWVYGGKKLFSVQNYKKIAKVCKDQDIEWCFLYQGDQPQWTWHCWLNKIYNILGLFNWMIGRQQKRFSKAFGE